ncbi:MAG: diguanylate cyclase [Burkholderiales bacterium]
MNTSNAHQQLLWVAAIVAVVTGISLPALYFYQGLSGERAASQRLVHMEAKALSRVVANDSEDWKLLRGSLLQALALSYNEDTSVIDDAIFITEADGNVILSSADMLAQPRIIARAPFGDSGVTAGYVEHVVSLWPLLKRTLAVALAGVLLGALIYGVLRALPLRAVDRALAALQSEVTRAELALGETASTEIALRDNEAKLLRQAKNNHLLETLAGLANGASTPEETIPAFLRHLCEFTGWPLGHATLLDREEDCAIARADYWHGANGERFNAFVAATNGYRYPLKEGRFASQVIRTAAPVWAADLSIAGRFKNLADFAGSGLLSGVCFPITCAREVIGFFEFYSPAAVRPDADLADLIVRASVHVARVAERVEASQKIFRLNADLERRVAERGAQMEQANAELLVRNRETTLVGEMTGVLQVAEHLEEAGKLVARYLPVVLADSEGGALYLMRASRDHLERLSFWGNAASVVSFPPVQCWGMRRGQIHGSRDGAVPLLCDHLAADEAIGGSLCLPLLAQGESLGLLQIGYPKPSDREHQAMRIKAAKRVAEQLSLALANVRLRDSLREQSIRDALTGLHNRRYLEESLNREMARSARDEQPMALFMLDVDHFKRYNDNHGHEAGDAVLRELGRVLRECARASDIACRYGGEEFTAVLPNTHQTEASAWAGRLLQKVRAMQVRLGSRSLPPITISMGLAVFPHHGTGADPLLKAADAALYEAKHTGRDQLKVAPLPAIVTLV